MRILLLVSTMLVLAPAFANPPALQSQTNIGVIDKYTGLVSIHKNDSPMGQRVDRDNYPLHLNDILITKRNAQAFLTLADKSKVILDQRSTLTFDGMDSYDLSKTHGRVIFQIYKKKRLHGVKIKTNNAIIGVKGTTFAVDTSGDGFKLYMQEGSVSVDSIKGEFEVYKKSQMSEFQQYQQQFRSEYENYKSELNKEFHEYVKSLSVSGGDSISVVDNKVVHIKTPNDVKQMFNMLNSF